MTYSTGELYESRATSVGMCASLYVYLFLTGKVNYTVTGLSYGMNGRHVFPPGLIWMAIPCQWIPTVSQNLKEMKWVLPAYTMEREEYIAWDAKVRKETHQESENP